MDVREVMTPRVDVVALKIPVQADDVARAVRESGHSCFPVVHDDLDDLVGVLYVNDLFRSGRHPVSDTAPSPSPLDISRRVRQPLVVPESIGLLEALAEMRKQRRTFAVVVDEYGGVSGVLTIKDLLEPLVGDLHDEFDADEEPEIVRVDANRWLIDGRANVDEVAERLAIEIPDGEYVTLGGFLFDAFGHIPEEGERFTLTKGKTADEWEFRVVEMDKRRIARVVVRHEEPATDVAASELPGKDRVENGETPPGNGTEPKPGARVATPIGTEQALG
jgi:CBS domain containing-hemolysin-like protein